MTVTKELQPQLLGTGQLSWPRRERQTDRYGSIFLFHYQGDQEPMPWPTDMPIGSWGRLMVKVLETRHSFHLGDWARGIYPVTPAVGEEFQLGIGELFTETQDGYTSLGVAPEDGTATDWMSPTALYRAHDQTVELWFHPLPWP